MSTETPENRPFGGIKELLHIAWPLIISSGTFAVLHFCDRMFLAWYSEAACRAAVPAGILFFTLVCGFMALAGFTNTFVSQYWGAGDKEGCARSVAQGIFFSLLSVPLVLALLPIGLAALRYSDHGPEVLALEEQYLKILMGASFGMILSSALSAFFSGRGKTKVIMVCNVIANCVNIALNYLLIFGAFGFPEMGIAGAGWATVISSLINPLIMAIMLYTGSINHEFRMRKNFRFDRPLFLRMIRFGLPSGIHWFLDISAFTLFVLFVGRMGAVAHIASNIALSINLIAFMPTVGLGIATSVLVGQYLGRNQPEYAERVGWLSLRIGVGYTLLIALTFIFFPEFYAIAFMRGTTESIPFDELMTMVRHLLLMLAAWGSLDATGIIISGGLKGAGDTHFVMYFQTVLAWGFLVLGQIAIVFFFKAGVYISWGWTVLYILLLAIGFLLRFKSGKWKTIDLLDRRIPASTEQIPIEH